MARNRLRSAGIASVLIFVGACGSQPAANRSAEADAEAGEPQGQVERTEAPTPSPTPAQAPAATVIQTQPGSDGTKVALNRVAVTGDVLTVQLTYTGKGGLQRIKPRTGQRHRRRNGAADRHPQG